MRGLSDREELIVYIPKEKPAHYASPAEDVSFVNAIPLEDEAASAM